jgi:hypothetical protein
VRDEYAVAENPSTEGEPLQVREPAAVYYLPQRRASVV